MPRKKRRGGAAQPTGRKSKPQSPAAARAATSARKPVSAMLARRLAGAASGFPNGKKIWFYARHERKDLSFEVSQPIESDTVPPAPSDPAFGVFGPYETAARPEKRSPVAKVTLELTNGKKLELSAEHADAVFWGASALEKFAIPYYAALGGLELGMQIRDSFEDQNVVAMCHGPNTEYCLAEATESSTRRGGGFRVVAI